MEEKRIRRSNDKMLAGVCAGLAEYFGIDPVLMRLAFVILGLMGGPGIIIYGVLWIVMPDAEGVTTAPVSPKESVKE